MIRCSMRVLLLVLFLSYICTQCQANNLEDLLRKALDDHLPLKQPEHPVPKQLTSRNGRQIHSADPGALMYLPIGGSGNIRYRT